MCPKSRSFLFTIVFSLSIHDDRKKSKIRKNKRFSRLFSLICSFCMNITQVNLKIYSFVLSTFSGHNENKYPCVIFPGRDVPVMNQSSESQFMDMILRFLFLLHLLFSSIIDRRNSEEAILVSNVFFKCLLQFVIDEYH